MISKLVERSRNQLGALAYLDNTQKAYGHFQEATELDPENAEGWNWLGIIQRRKGELTQAEQAYQKVFQIGKASKSKKEEYFQKRLKIELELGRKAGMASKYANLGSIYEILQDFTKAREYWEKSLKLYQQVGMPPMIEKVQSWLDGLPKRK